MNTLLHRLTPTLVCVSLLTGLHLVAALRAESAAQPIARRTFRLGFTGLPHDALE